LKIEINEIPKENTSGQDKTPSQSHECEWTPPKSLHSPIPQRFSFSSIGSTALSPMVTHQHHHFNSFSSIAAESIILNDNEYHVHDENTKRKLCATGSHVHTRNITDSIPGPQWL